MIARKVGGSSANHNHHPHRPSPRHHRLAGTLMKYKKLRIGWSEGWGLVALLLVGLWVRRYWRTDSLQTIKLSQKTVMASGRGFVMFDSQYYVGPIIDRIWKFDSLPTKYDEQFPSPSFLGFFLQSSDINLLIIVPYWCLIFISAIVAGLAVTPLHWHFSLRTLLLATTILALALGTFAWLAH